MKVALILFLFLRFSSSLSFAQVGNAGMQFLKPGVSARSIAMGEVAASLGSDAAAAYNNPALLSQENNSYLQIFHSNLMANTTMQFLGAKTTFNRFAFAYTLNTTNIPNFEIRTIPGEAEGTFGVHYFASGIAASYSVDDNVSLGIGGKLLYEKIFIDDATGFAFDFGSRKKFENQFVIGASLNNLGAMSKLRNTSTTLPTTLRIGAAYPLALSGIHSEILFAADAIDILPEKQVHISTGAEFLYDKIFALRLGYQSGFEAKKNWSVGLGITYNTVIFDYAFVPYNNNYAAGHTIAISYIFE